MGELMLWLDYGRRVSLATFLCTLVVAAVVAGIDLLFIGGDWVTRHAGWLGNVFAIAAFGILLPLMVLYALASLWLTIYRKLAWMTRRPDSEGGL